MSVHNNPNLLFIFFYALISTHSTTSHLPPSISPFPQPKSSPGPASSPSQSPIPSSLSNNYVSFPPSNPPSESLSPNANSPSQPDDPFPFDEFSKTINSIQIDPKVKEICSSTDYPTLCLATVLPLIKNQPKVDVPSICEIAVNATTKLAEFALSMANKLMENPETPPDLVSVLKDCRSSYDDAVYNFQSAQNAFPGRDIGTMNSMLSAVITDVGDCEDAFSGLGRHSPLSNYADRLTNMTSNCLAIISLMG